MSLIIFILMELNFDKINLVFLSIIQLIVNGST
jgi:hypothetical protein